jgi:hypothetical protein
METEDAPATDSAALSRAAAGDEAAFAEIVHRPPRIPSPPPCRPGRFTLVGSSKCSRRFRVGPPAPSSDFENGSDHRDRQWELFLPDSYERRECRCDFGRRAEAARVQSSRLLPLISDLEFRERIRREIDRDRE